MALLLLVVLLSECFECCDSVLPAYIPALRENQDVHRNVLVREYFLLGLNNAEILSFLVLVHGIRIGLRQLKRVLRALGLRRRSIQSDAQEIIHAVEFELRGSGASVGYRQMHQRLTKDHGLFVNRETVRNIVKELDPEGVAYRSKRKLRRRKYYTKGPNYIWHIDGYDKLKPFGFCIHGAIDGFSRRILWLDVGSTNNNPRVVAQYFLDCVHQVGGLPIIVRADAGTENVNVAAIQRLLRRDSHDYFAGEKSFMYGKSTSNQRMRRGGLFYERQTQIGGYISLKT